MRLCVAQTFGLQSPNLLSVLFEKKSVPLQRRRHGVMLAVILSSLKVIREDAICTMRVARMEEWMG